MTQDENRQTMTSADDITKNVLLVEDDDRTRARLARLIGSHPGLQVCASCADLQQGMQSLRDDAPDVLVTDLGLPDGSGIELIRQARSLYHENIEIMVITVFGDERNVLTAIEAGASSYLLKDGDTEYIGKAIIQMLAGESPISAAIARQLLKRYRNDSQTTENDAQQAIEPARRHAGLTDRETQVLRAMAKGYTYNEAAKLLGMSANTVASHIKKIYRKLDVNSRSEAVYEAVQMGLVDMQS